MQVSGLTSNYLLNEHLLVMDFFNVKAIAFISCLLFYDGKDVHHVYNSAYCIRDLACVQCVVLLLMNRELKKSILCSLN